MEVSLTGQLLLNHPLLNKSSTFPEDERQEFGLLGLLTLADILPSIHAAAF